MLFYNNNNINQKYNYYKYFESTKARKKGIKPVCQMKKAKCKIIIKIDFVNAKSKPLNKTEIFRGRILPQNKALFRAEFVNLFSKNRIGNVGIEL